jgi:hypothetical protein
MAKTTIADWLDRLESALEAEARLSGLFDHATTTGQAREFLVARVLKTILPPIAHIGSGKVIDSLGNSSRQIDIIIYDARFPLMRVEGGGLYFVEGVLATIEVKSIVDSRELETALENCRSVLTLGICGEHPEEAAARITFYMEKGALTRENAEERFHYMLHPATYVFGFNSNLSLETTASCIKNWWDSFGCARSTYFPLLPRVIDSGNVVGFINDGRISLISDKGTDHVMSLFETHLRFRWLALHLMDAVSLRLGLRNCAEGFDYRLSGYYPWDEYVRPLRQAKTVFITRQTVQRQHGSE